MSPIKVAVLDDYLNLSQPRFEKLDKTVFEVTVFTDTLLPYNHPDTPENVRDMIVRRLEPYEIICTMRERTPFPAELINRLPRLKLLLTTGVRNASLDLEALRARGIPVAGAHDKQRGRHDSNAMTTGTDSTTEHCVALILGLARGLVRDHNAVHQAGLWQTGCALGLSGRTFATLGLGRLGTAVARIMHTAFGMRVIAWSESLTQARADEQARTAGLPVETGGQKTFRVVSREELFRTADVLSIHLVLSARTRGLVKAADLALMKKSAMLVNTSRAGLVVTEDLLGVLERGDIYGAAIDVFDLEPLPPTDPWRKTKWGEDGRSQVLLTPHMGYVEEKTLGAWYEMQVENILRWHKGEELLLPF